MGTRRRKLAASFLVAVATEELQTQACVSEMIASKPWKKCRVRKKARNRLKWREFVTMKRMTGSSVTSE